MPRPDAQRPRTAGLAAATVALAGMLHFAAGSLAGPGSEPTEPFDRQPTMPRPTDQQPRVLILSTFEPYIPSAMNQERGVRRALATRVPYASIRCDYVLPVHMSRIAPNPQERLQLAAELRSRHDGRTPDLLIVIDTLAFDLISREARDVFQGVPVVFSGLVWDEARVAAAGLNATGVLERVDAAGVVDLIKRLQPEATTVLFTAQEQDALAPLSDAPRAQLGKSYAGVEIRWTKARSVDELVAEAAALPPGRASAVVHMSFFDRNVPNANWLGRLAETGRPIYATYFSQMGTSGVVAGRVVSSEKAGFEAGVLASRVLLGETASSIPPLVDAALVFTANHSMLERWGIDPTLLPEGTVVLNSPEPWLKEYRQLLAWGVLSVSVQAMVIALLLVQRARARRAEAALQAERDRLNLCLESSTQGAWDWDPATDTTHWSREFAARLGIPDRTGEAGGPVFEDRIHPDDRVRVASALHTHLTSDAPYDVEYRLRMPEGAYRWFRSRGRATRDGSRRAVRVAGAITDVHEIVLARTALGDSEQRFRAAFERHMLPMFVYERPTGRILLANRAMSRGYGYPLETLLEMRLPDLISPDEIARLEALFRDSPLEAEHEGIWRHRAADGRELEVTISSIPVPWDGHPGARLVTSIDLTAKNATQRALAESERFIQQIASAVPVVIYVYDLPDGRSRYVNRRIQDTLGYSPEHIRGMGGDALRELMEPADWRRYGGEHLPRLRAARDHEVVEFEYRLRHADGSWRWLMGRDMVLARGPDGEPMAVVGSAVDVTEQRDAAERLAKSENRLTMALHAGGMGVYDWDLVSGSIDWSSQHAEIWEIPLEDFDGSYAVFASRVHPDDLPELDRLVELAMSEKTQFRHEYRLRMPDGAIKWVLGRGEFVYDQVGSPVRMVGLATDVTKRREAEQALRNSEATNRALLNAVPDLMFRMDREGRYLDYHAPDPAMLIVPPERFLGRSMEEVLPDFVLAPTRENLARAFQTQAPQSFEYEAPAVRGRSSATAWEVRMVPIDADTALVLVRDITARRQAEELLRESRHRLNMLINATPLGVLFIDATFRVLEWNPGAERVFGYQASEVLGKRADFLVPDSERRYVEQIYRQLIANTGGFRGTNTNLRKDGREISCEWYNSPLLDPDGKVLGVACIVEDVTERAQAARRRSRMIAELDHRVKNNLASIISLAELTGRGAASVPVFIDRFRGRLYALARMHTILARSRWEGTDLRELLANTLDAFGASQRSSIDGPAVTLSPRAAQSLAMALNELATNAAKYGSLSAVAGRLDVTWSVSTKDAAQNLLELVWTESGGPPVLPPARRGFGSELIQGTIGFELHGVVDADYRPQGLVCRLSFPLVPDAPETGESVLEMPLHLDGAQNPSGS